MKRISPTVALALLGLIGVGSQARAQIVTISNANFVAGPPAKANPSGTYSVPANYGNCDVMVDYGVVTNGIFAIDPTIGAGYKHQLGAVGAGGAVGFYTGGGPETLKNPLPANTHCRTRLMRQKADGTWEEKAAAYQFLNPAGNGGGGANGGD